MSDTNLIVNGDFEDNTLNDTGWGLFSAIPGWTALAGKIEINEGAYAAGNTAGDAVVELDASGNSTLAQTVTIDAAGTYQLAFEYTMRGTDPSTNGFEIFVDGVSQAVVSPTEPGWTAYSLDLSLGTGSHEIAIAARGTSDGVGTYIDDVSLRALDVPLAPSDDQFQLDADTAVSGFDVLDNDSGSGLDVTDFSGGALDTPVVVSSQNGRDATVTLSADGTLTVETGGAFDDLAEGESDTLLLTYTVTDADGVTDTANVTVTIDGAVTPPVLGANLIVNGDFEDNTLNDTGWGLFSAIPGWTALAGKIEINEGAYAAGNTAGDAVVELDASGNSTLAQTVTIDAAGTYQLAFEYTMRGTDPSTNGFEIFVDGVSQAVVSPTEPGWTAYSLDLSLGTGSHEIAIAARGTSDGVGTYIDDVSLRALDVPLAPSDDQFQLDADTAVSGFDVLDNDSGSGLDVTDFSGGALDTPVVVSSQNGRDATVTLSADGTLTVETGGAFDDLAEGESDTLLLTYTVTDADGVTDTANVTVTIDGAVTPPVLGANLIVNGDFEDNTLNDTGWGLFSAIPGWTALAGKIEINEGAYAAGNTAGDAVVELDASGNSTLAQTVTIDAAGTYQLAFEYTMRGTDPSTNGFEIFVDGVSQAVVSPTEPGWTAYSLDLSLGTGSHEIAIAARGTSDGVGTYIDDVSLRALDVPLAPSDDQFQLDADTAVSGFDVLDNDSGSGLDVTDFSGGALDTPVVVSSQNGRDATVTLSADGTLTVETGGAFDDLAEGESDTLLLTYTVTDADGVTDTANVTVTIDGAVTPPVLGANLIVNGDFEDNTLNDTGWGLFSAIPGWTALAGKIEINEGAYAAGNTAGDAVVELDASGNSTLAQTVTIDAAGTYQLAFEYTMRGTDPSTNGFEIFVDGVSQAVVSPTEPGWTAYSLDLSLGTGSHEIAIAARGTSDGVGTYIDDVSLRALDVPLAPSDDQFQLDADTAVSGFDVLDNDSGSGLDVTDFSGGALDTPVVVSSQNGRDATVTLSADGTLTVETGGAFDDLAEGESDTLLLTYTVTDADGVTDTANVTVTIDGIAPTLSFAGTTTPILADLETHSYAEAAALLSLGDSITRGLDTPGGYRLQLWNGLVHDTGLWYDSTGNETTNPGLVPHDIDHQGINWMTAAQVADDIGGIVATNEVDVALILLGSNDTILEPDPVNSVPLDLMTIMQTLEAANPDVKIFLGTILERDSSSAQATIDAINAQLPDLVSDATTSGIDVTLVDFSSITTADTYDGVHPTASGYETMAEIWQNALLAETDTSSGTFNEVTQAIAADVSRVLGSDAGDRLAGDANANTLDGRGGDDLIIGRAGNDVLSGGEGSDVFVFALNDGTDTITDFEASLDWLQLVGPESDFVGLTQTGLDAHLAFGDTTVVIENVDTSLVQFWFDEFAVA